mgnify:CR=1 FL=1
MVSTYIRGLIFFSLALPVMTFSRVQEITPMRCPQRCCMQWHCQDGQECGDALGRIVELDLQAEPIM